MFRRQAVEVIKRIQVELSVSEGRSAESKRLHCVAYRPCDGDVLPLYKTVDNVQLDSPSECCGMGCVVKSFGVYFNVDNYFASLERGQIAKDDVKFCWRLA